MNTAELTVLPPSASALERAVDRSAPHWQALAEAVRPGPGDHPTAFLPWLATEWGLAEFAPYFEDTPALVSAALPWLFERGAGAGVLRALGWVGFPDAALDEDGAWLHIDLGRTATATELARAVHVVRASLPAHVHFYRVFWQYDLRHLRLDHGRPLDNALLDDDSGVWVHFERGQPLKASFGHRHIQAPPPAAARQLPGLQVHLRSVKLTHDDRMHLDSWRLDSHLLVDSFGGVCAVLRGDVPTPTRGAPLLTYGLAHVARSAPASDHTRATGGAQALRTGHVPSALPRSGRWLGRWDQRRWRTSIPGRRAALTE